MSEPEFEHRVSSDDLVSLTRFVLSDADDLARYDTDPELARRFDFPVDFVPSKAHSENVIRDWIRLAGQGTQFTFAVRMKGEQLLVGGCEIRVQDEGRGEVSFWIYPPFRGRGFAKRALSLLSEWGFTTLDVERLQALVEIDNRASSATCRKAGFREEGILAGYSPLPGGGRRDMVSFSLLRSDR